jgi:hypothetical protein
MRLKISRCRVPTSDFARRIIPFGKTKIDQDAVSGLVVEQEIRRFHVSVHDAPTMTVVETAKQASHVFSDIGRVQMSEEELMAGAEG